MNVCAALLTVLHVLVFCFRVALELVFIDFREERYRSAMDSGKWTDTGCEVNNVYLCQLYKRENEDSDINFTPS